MSSFTLVVRVYRWELAIDVPLEARMRHLTDYSPSKQRFAVLCLAAVLCTAAELTAQGATGAAVQGTVAGASGTPVADATVLITNIATGERWQTLTRANGRFFLGHLSIGGPYRFEVRAIGFAPAERAGVFLSLGQRMSADFGLVPVAFQLEEVTVHAGNRPAHQRRAHRTGPNRSRVYYRPPAGRRPRLHQPRAALAPGHDQRQRRTLIRRPTRSP